MTNSNENVERKLSADEISSFKDEKEKEIHNQLWDACVAGDVKTIKETLKANNIDVNVRLQCERTLLMLAADNNQTRLVSFLLNQPGINVSLVEHDGATALSFALKVWKDSEPVNHEIADMLIRSGADINQVTFNSTPLLHAWYRGQSDRANVLILLGANINSTEDLFNSDIYKNQRAGADGVPNQIALSKQFLQELNSAQNLGIGIEELSHSRKLVRDIGSHIVSFLLTRNTLAIQAFNIARNNRMQELLPEAHAPQIPPSLLFSENFENLPRPVVDDLVWQQWANNYNRDFPEREEAGYGPGAMVLVSKP